LLFASRVFETRYYRPLAMAIAIPLVEEKKDGIRELLRLKGVTLARYFSSHLVIFTAEAIVLSTVAAVLLYASK
jgi:hypothetical protein